MTPRSLSLPVLVALAAAVAAVGLADDPKPATKADDKEIVLPVPPDPKVEYKLTIPKKDFSETIEESIRIPDQFDETKFTLSKTKSSFDMVFVPGGKFEMGSPEDETGRDANEGPRHKVAVRSFWLAKFETTWDVFDLWYRNNGLPRRDEAVGQYEADHPGGGSLKPDAVTRPTNPYVDDSYGHVRAAHPAVSMSHHSAMMFCHWLRLKSGKPYRLPTEAEWEYACRAGHDGPYGFDTTKGKLDDYAWYKDNSKDDERPGGTTHEPGKKSPNKYGLYDMHGNVAEWTLDQFDAKAYEARATAADSLKALSFTPPTEKKWSHTARGGSWTDPAEKCRSAARRVSEVKWMSRDPQFPRSIWWLTERDMIGFRVCLPLDEYPELVGLKPAVVKAGR